MLPFELKSEINLSSLFVIRSVKYFSSGEEKFEELKQQLREAKEYIFMEYFILEKGEMWGEILDILKDKVWQGVDVRVMYDGTCSLFILPYHYEKELRRAKIKCKQFSPIRPVLSSHQNNRDHRKICVIDGKVAFTGGINLADEYINRKVRFGHWKDTAIMIEGEAVQIFTMMFLCGIFNLSAQSVRIGLQAPDFSIELQKDGKPSGKTVTLADYKGKALLLHFWATWCPPCKVELPHLEKLVQKIQSKNQACRSIYIYTNPMMK